MQTSTFRQQRASDQLKNQIKPRSSAIKRLH